MYSYGHPHMAVQKQDDKHEHTFSSCVRIRDNVLRTWQERWTIGRGGEGGSGISVLPARHDDDDDLCMDMLSTWQDVTQGFFFIVVVLGKGLSNVSHMNLLKSNSKYVTWVRHVSLHIASTTSQYLSIYLSFALSIHMFSKQSLPPISLSLFLTLKISI